MWIRENKSSVCNVQRSTSLRELDEIVVRGVTLSCAAWERTERFPKVSRCPLGVTVPKVLLPG